MSEFWYDIEQFKWNDEVKAFVADEASLWYPGYLMPFPNQGRQFYVENEKTRNFRRFRLATETVDEWIFKSEDEIKCVVKKEKEQSL